MPAARFSQPVFWTLSLLIALSSWRFMFGGVEQTMEFVAYHAQERRVAFFAHVGLAPVALALTPFQLSAGLRRRRPDLHRWMGRVSAVAIALSGIGGLSMAIGTNAGPVAAWGFALLAVVWVACMVMGVAQAMRGRLADHRAWMIRTAALTLAGVTLRLMLPVGPMAFGLPFDAAYPAIAWLCWIPNLIVAEWVLRREKAGP
ncbi:MAG: putative membrane protein [Paracoccaceae bacterium]|jgi:uncharacterized membrane protein